MATLRAIDGAWVLDWRDQDGGRHRDTLGRIGKFPEKEARRILKLRNAQLSAGYRILNPEEAPTFASFVSDYLLWHAAEYPASHQRVRQIVEDYLTPAFQHARLDALKPRDVEAWKHRRLAPRDDRPKAETVSKELRTLKAILSKAVEWRVIGEHPFPHVSAPLSLDSKPPRFYTKDELKALYAACRMQVNNGEGPQPNPLHAWMWRLYANTGMRRMEGVMLKRAWIGPEAMKILSTDEERTKSGKWREIPLTKGAQRALDELPRDGEYVLPRMAPASMSRACINDARRAGLDGGLHTLRHTYISHLVMAGVPLRTVQKLAGHSTVMVTERYSHLTPGHLLQAGQRINL
jgi:integrase